MSKTGLNSRRLGDIGSVKMCKRILKEQTSQDAEIPFYKISTFGGVADTFIGQTTYDEYKRKYSYPKVGDILISAAGTVGKTVIFDGKPSYFQDSNIVWVEHDESVVTNRYLYYFYKTEPWRTTNGSTITRIYNENLRDIIVPAPPIPQQKRIAAVLSVLDDKIELNRRINAELEQMARTLYDYWFVQFDFPGSDGKPYKSSGGAMKFSPELNREIPEDWKIYNLSELLPIVTGKHDANHAISNGKYNFFTCGEEILKCDTYKFEGKSILVAGNGTFGIKRYNGKFDAYQRTYVLIPENERLYTVVYLSVLDKVNALTKGARGSIVKFITKGDLEGIHIPMPININSVDGLLEALNTITEKIETNYKESQKLAHLRDWLLPMLMNGQVTVGGSSNS